jgi:hypothetical protein
MHGTTNPKKRKEFDLETHLAFLEYVKASENVKRNFFLNITKQSYYKFIIKNYTINLL